jgi:hypothetical protein
MFDPPGSPLTTWPDSREPIPTMLYFVAALSPVSADINPTTNKIPEKNPPSKMFFLI